MRFFNITESNIEATNNAFSASCEKRGIDYIQVDPEYFDYQHSDRPEPGDLMYRTAVDMACIRLEHLLYQEGVATLYRNGPFFECFNQIEYLSRHGIPTPKMVYSVKRSRETLLSHVDYLGGYPLVLKIPGSEGGVGVIKVESNESLFSLIDYLAYSPLMMNYFDHIVSYRLIVLGNEVIDCEARCSGAMDFRTNAWGGDSLGQVDASDEVKQIAIDAAGLLNIEFGGVDIMQSETGELCFCELNFPCYFADQQRDSGVEISGKIIDYLAGKVTQGSLSKQALHPNPSTLSGLSE